MGNIIEMPSGGRNPGFNAGSVRSVARLASLKFDPLEKLVVQYNRLEEEIEKYKEVRDGRRIEVIETDPNTGKQRTRKFSYEVLLQMEDKLIAIGTQLLRYGYGRVPEGDGAGNKPAGSSGLRITLNGVNKTTTPKVITVGDVEVVENYPESNNE